MKVIVGSYRGPGLVNRCLRSLVDHVSGITKVVIVDDSGNLDWAEQYHRSLLRWNDGSELSPEVVAINRRGYNEAMKAVCANANGHRFMFLEEDFTFEKDVDLDAMAGTLEEHPDWAQLALLRGPHFPNEHEAAKLVGNEAAVLVALRDRLGREFVDLIPHFTDHDDVVLLRDLYDRPAIWNSVGATVEAITQRGTFTCNPAVWQEGVSSRGWPDGRWSEDRMRDLLLADGYVFGFLPGIKVKHDGERSGFGY